MSEMIDRVARTLWKECGCDQFSDFDKPTHPNGPVKFRALAKAAIEAMRDPTQNMKIAALGAMATRQMQRGEHLLMQR